MLVAILVSVSDTISIIHVRVWNLPPLRDRELLKSRDQAQYILVSLVLFT